VRAFAVLSALLLALSGCETEEIVVTVDLFTDFAPGAGFAIVYTEIAADEVAAASDEDLYRPVEGDDFLSRGVRVAEFRGVSAGPAALRVRLEQADGTVVGEQNVLLDLAGSYAASATISTGCVTGDEPECNCTSDADCGDLDGGCVVGRCSDGACLGVPDDGRCGAEEACSRLGVCEYDGACASACDRPECEGEACNDGEACTHDDRCSMGSCGGTPIVCEGTPCAAAFCDGTDTCGTMNLGAGTACPDDDNPCTTDACDGTGVCAHSAMPEGTQWDGVYDRCCGGRALTVTSTDDCGQCGARCEAGQECGFNMGAPTCVCTMTRSCPFGALCLFGGCWCENDGQCDAEARCSMSPMHNFCTYD